MATSIGILERMRWMSALATAAMIALLAMFALSSANGQLPSLSVPASASAPMPTPGGSSAPLDPRIATLAARHPGAQLEAIVQFDGGISLTRARVITQRAGGRVAGTLAIINGLAVKMTAAQARRLAASPAVHSVTLNTQVASEGGPMLGGPE